MCNAAQSTLAVKLWLVPMGTPVNVKGITATETGAVLNGMIASAEGAGGVSQGGLMTATLGFALQSPDATTSVAPATLSTVDGSIAGVGSLNANPGRGSLKLTGEKGVKLPLAVAGPKGQQGCTPPFSLSTQKLSDPNGGALTYKWALIPALARA